LVTVPATVSREGDTMTTTIPPRPDGWPSKANLTLALDGHNFLETSIPFTFYDEPNWSDPKPNKGALGKDLAFTMSAPAAMASDVAKVMVNGVGEAPVILPATLSEVKAGWELQCTIPAVTEPTEATVSVALNGQEFSSKTSVINFGKK